MKIGSVKPLASSIVLACWFLSSHAFAASASPALLKAKQEAESKGFIFETSHDEIVARAKKEGKLRLFSSLESDTFKPLIESFRKKYPSIEVRMEELSGTEATQRFLLELKAGTVKDFDVAEAASDFYNEFAAHAMKFDILGMAQQGVLAINSRMVDSNYRNLVSLATTICGAAYNKSRVSPDKVPDRWEDFLKPEFKGRKFIADIRTQCMAAMIPGLGEEWVLNYARGLKEQQPVWVRGNTRALNSIAVGEQALHQMTFYSSCMRAHRKDPTKSLVCKIIEPVPVLIRETHHVLTAAPHPYAALLFIEHEASPEGQKVIDDYEPLKSNLYAEGEVAKIIKGKRLSLNDHGTFQNTPKWMKMVLEAFGFPKADK